MRKLQYLVRINQDPGSDWGASVPDLPGCVATGKTIDAALRRIQGAIELHLRGMREDGQKPPKPQSRVVTPKRTARQVQFFATVRVAALRCIALQACLILTAVAAYAYTGGPVRAVVDGFDPLKSRVYYSLWFYDESGSPPQVYYFDLKGPKPEEPVRDKSLEHPETEPFVGVFPRHWYELKTGLVKLHGLRDFEMKLQVRADSIGVSENHGETHYSLSVAISTANRKQSMTLEAFCEPVVRVMGLYRIPGRPDVIAVVSRIGRAYGCEEVETPVLLQSSRRPR